MMTSRAVEQALEKRATCAIADVPNLGRTLLDVKRTGTRRTKVKSTFHSKSYASKYEDVKRKGLTLKC